MIANYNLPCIQTVLSNSQFRNVLDQTSEDVLLCKRRPNYTSSADENSEVAPAKLLKVMGSTKPCHSAGDAHSRIVIRRMGAESPNSSSISSKNQASRTTCEAECQTDEEQMKVNNSLVYLLKNQFECQKQLTKHFIFESFLNEKLNMSRYEFLPTACKNQVSIFIKECIGFDIQSETKSGSNRKHLYTLKNRLTETQDETQRMRKVMAFKTQCYLYGLRKQLHCDSTVEGDKLLVKTLFKTIHPESKDLQLRDKFGEVLFSLAEDNEAFDSDAACGVLTNKLLSKIRQLPDSVLKKYYQIMLSKYLSSLFEGCLSSHDIIDRLLPLTRTIDIYSNFQTELVPKSRTYQLAVFG